MGSDFSLLNMWNSSLDPTSRTCRGGEGVTIRAMIMLFFGLELEKKKKNGEEEVSGVDAVIMLHLLLLLLIWSPFIL